MLANALLGPFGGPRLQSQQKTGKPGISHLPRLFSLLSWRPQGDLNPVAGVKYAQRD
jgi:hypothetical protein